MTNPVVLLGTQSNGETLPVQVDATGRLVAEGLEGPPGEKGDAFTYEDFTAEQLEGLQGPPGPSGPDDLKPYGPENSYLIIQNGKPTWVADGSEPAPPGPVDPVMLIDKRDEPVSGVTDLGAYADSGFYLEPLETWDAYARTLPTWETPQAKRAGIGGLNQTNGNLVIPFTFNLTAGLGMVLEIDMVHHVTCQPGNLNSFTSEHYIQCSTEEDKLQIISNTFKSSCPAEESWFLNTASFFVQRDSIGLVDFRFSASSSWPDYTDINGIWVQRWRFVDPGAFLLQRQLNRIQTLRQVGQADLLNS